MKLEEYDLFKIPEANSVALFVYYDGDKNGEDRGFIQLYNELGFTGLDFISINESKVTSEEN